MNNNVNDYLKVASEMIKDENLLSATRKTINDLFVFAEKEYKRGYEDGLDMTFSEFKVWLKRTKGVE